MRLRKLNEFKITGVYSRKAVHRETATRQFLYDEKVVFLIAYIATIKKVHAFHKFVSVLIAFVAINYKEMPQKDFASKYILEVNVVA